jgi:small-conductance mechanosensitive channel
MKDLLNEEEFLPKEYNPWKWYNTYSLLGLSINSCLLLTTKYFTYNSSVFSFTIIFMVFIIPILFSVLISFYPKQYRTITPKTRSLGIALIYSGNFIGILISAVFIYISNNILVNIWLVITIILCLNMISYSIITTLLNAITKALNRKTSEENERPA